MTELSLDGVLDLHVHTNPDVKPRAVDDIAMARHCVETGMRGYIIKSHDWATHNRAYLVRQIIPECETFGSICLNRSHGERINSFAVEQALKTYGDYCKCVWLPTRESAYDMKRRGMTGVPVVDGSGKVLPEVLRVMEICAEHDIILASGHSDNDEVVTLARAAKKLGLKKFVLTHVTSDPWLITPDNLKRCFEFGAYAEHSYVALIWGAGTPFPDFRPCPVDMFIDYIKICPERTFISSDLGTADMMLPGEGMIEAMKLLKEHGFAVDEINRMCKSTPATLLNLPIDG